MIKKFVHKIDGSIFFVKYRIIINISIGNKYFAYVRFA